MFQKISPIFFFFFHFVNLYNNILYILPIYIHSEMVYIYIWNQNPCPVLLIARNFKKTWQIIVTYVRRISSKLNRSERFRCFIHRHISWSSLGVEQFIWWRKQKSLVLFWSNFHSLLHILRIFRQVLSTFLNVIMHYFCSCYFAYISK